MRDVLVAGVVLLWTTASVSAADTKPAGAPADWQIGEPIVTYWAGPKLDDRAATQMAEGGFNLVWSGEDQLDVAQRHGLRAMLRNGLLRPGSLDNPDRRSQLDAVIDRVKNHPALYAYYIVDEPDASRFAALGRLVAYLRERDPAHLAYINLFPTYATNKQLGTTGNVITAYRKYLEQFVETVKPDLISYDHYQFGVGYDTQQYFLNLAMVRQAAKEATLPFVNIVQACTWAPKARRIPNPDEMRYLVYTTVAYGAEGISYYVYSHPRHLGSIVGTDGKPGPLYDALKSYNPEFVAVARELQPLRSLGVYHTAMKEAGCEPLPADAKFQIDEQECPARPRGFLLGVFGKDSRPTHVVVVNLDYTTQVTTELTGPGLMSTFDAATGQWQLGTQRRVELVLSPGGGKLVRLNR